MIACLKFICTIFKLDISKINLWLLSWFNVLLSIDKLDLIRYMPSFLKYPKVIPEKSSAKLASQGKDSKSF